MRTLVLPVVALLGGCAAQHTGGEQTTNDGFTPLFNGRDLSGWAQRGGKAEYKAEDGCIVGTTVPNQLNSFLCTNDDYSDFILELDFKIDDGANSGVQIRSQSLATYQEGRVHGYQVEIDPSERAWTGGIYDEARRGWLAPLDKNPTAQAAFKHNQWNHFRIEATGALIRTWLNDVPATALQDSMTPRGFIALQVHTVGGRTEALHVWWKNIRIKVLDGSSEPRH